MKLLSHRLAHSNICVIDMFSRKPYNHLLLKICSSCSHTPLYKPFYDQFLSLSWKAPLKLGSFKNAGLNLMLKGRKKIIASSSSSPQTKQCLSLHPPPPRNQPAEWAHSSVNTPQPSHSVRDQRTTHLHTGEV